MRGCSGRIRGWAALAVMLISAAAWAESIDLVTYFPVAGSRNDSGQDLQVKSLRVGDPYRTLPDPDPGVAVVWDKLAIGIPVPASGTITPPWALQVVGIPNELDKVLLEPGAGGTMELEVNGNVRLPPTAATTFGYPVPFPTAGAFLYRYDGGASKTWFIHNYGTENTFMGWGAGNFTLTGTGNTGLGAQSLTALIAGNNNTAVGFYALNSTRLGNDTTVIGHMAGRYTKGTSSTIAGYMAFNNGSGDNNLVVGYSALPNSINNNSNIAIGQEALYYTSTGNANTAVGTGALRAISTSSGNTAIGHQAGMGANAGGSLFLGHRAGILSSGYANYLFLADPNWDGFNLIEGSSNAQIRGSLQITSVPSITGVDLKSTSWGYMIGRDLAELFSSSAGPLPAGTIAALGAGGGAVAATAGSQTLGPIPALPGILMDGSSQRIGPTPEEVNVPGKTAVALLGRVSVQTQGPVQIGDVLVAGLAGKAVRWEPGQSALSYVGLVLEVNPAAQIATALVGHQGLRKVLDSIQHEERILEEDLNKLQEKLERMEQAGG